MVTAPDETPFTTPPVPTVATAVLALLQVPPGLASANVVLAPTHTLTGPGGVMAEGLAFTVTVAVTKQPPKV